MEKVIIKRECIGAAFVPDPDNIGRFKTITISERKHAFDEYYDVRDMDGNQYRNIHGNSINCPSNPTKKD